MIGESPVQEEGGWGDVEPSSGQSGLGIAGRLSRWTRRIDVHDMLADISTMNPDDGAELGRGARARMFSPSYRNHNLSRAHGDGDSQSTQGGWGGEEGGLGLEMGNGQVVRVAGSENYVMSEKNRRAVAQVSQNRIAVTKLGTVKGVFLPCFQNILGVILWIRLPYITGQAGIWATMGIVALSKITTLLTTLSMSAIATNGTVQAGGPYYIISRNLGVEMGGAIGSLFYLGTAISSSMYVLGAVETIESSFGVGGGGFSSQGMALLIMGGLVAIAFLGIRYVNMSSIFFLGIVLFSLVSIILGALLFAIGAYDGQLSSEDREPFDNFLPVYAVNPDTGLTPTFFSLLAMFFPAATGIMAGCNRSAVLATPGKSIPRGTLDAIACTTGLYLLFIWLFGCSMANEVLIEDKLVEMRVAWPAPYIVGFGIIFSCLGAALQGIVGASGILAAIATDRTIPLLAHFAPLPDAEPARAVLLTGLIAALPCLAGNLDYITPVVTMFFLLMYGSVNLSCFVLTILKSPGFRPQWIYYSWHTALLGLLFCVALMVIISWHWAVLAIALAFGLLGYIKYQNASRDWGDALAGFRYQMARDMLLTMGRDRRMHAKNWRPQILLFCDIDSRGNPLIPELLSLAGQMKMGRGLLLAVGMLKGDPEEEDGGAVVEAQRVLSMHLEDENIEGFAEVSMCEDFSTASITVMQHCGIGTMRPNAVFVTWCEDWTKNHDKGTALVHLLRGAVRASKAAMVLKGALALPSQFESLNSGDTIDIWWLQADGGLLLLIPYLLTLHPVWKRCTLRLYCVIVDAKDDPRQVETSVREYLDQVRIKASVFAVDMSDSKVNSEAYREEMVHRSEAADASNIGIGGVTVTHEAHIKSGLRNHLEDIGELEELELDASGDRQSVAGIFSSTLTSLSPQRGDRRTDEDVDRSIAAVLLNRNMRLHSAEARLIVTNLPLVPEMDALDILEYVDQITSGLAPVLLIKGTGDEVVTTVA